MGHLWQRLLRCLVVGALVAGALVPIPALAATSWSVKVGAQTADMGAQANGYFNRDITVNVGDTVNWTWGTGEIHTVTFLSGAQEPDFLVVNGGQLLPNFPYVGPLGGPTYNGSGIASSGVFGFGVPTTFSLKFTQVGTYSYLCLVHKGMEGSVTVNPAGTPYPATQATYDERSAVEQARLLTLASKGLESRAIGRANPDEVTVGIGQLMPNIGGLAVLRFLPDPRTVHVGQTLTWTNLDPQTPHTVTFGKEPPGAPLGAYAPSTNVSGGHATIASTADSVNSGFIANDPFFEVSNTFSATFTSPGTYNYFCALHDDLGMKGSIVVLP